MIEQVPFKASHLLDLEMRAHEAREYSEPEALDRLLVLACRRLSYTIMCDGKVIGIIGVLELWDGVCEVWLLPSTGVPKHTLAFSRKIKDNIKVLEKQYRRIQTHSVDDALHNRWMKWLGFTCEGNLKKYSKFKEDYKIWAKVV